MFSCSFYILFVGFQSIHAFLIYFSKIFTRLLFAPFPLACCIFNVFFQEFYPSPSFSDRFCTISSGCYCIFLHFHCLFPTCLLHRHSLFLAVTPVSSMFQQILHGLFLAFSSDRYHVFLKFHCIFQYILFVGFQYVLSSIFYYMFPIIFTSFLHRFLHHFLWFPAFSYLFNININPRVLPVSFIFRSFLHHVLSLLSHFPALSLYLFTVSSWFAPSIRSGLLHFPRDFPWFVPSIRSVFVRFPGDFVRFPLIVIVFLQFHRIFQYILMVSPATKRADLGGIDTPRSANCLVVHNPAKCSVFSRSTQGHGEISFPFGNHPPPTPPILTSFANSN